MSEDTEKYLGETAEIKEIEFSELDLKIMQSSLKVMLSIMTTDIEELEEMDERDLDAERKLNEMLEYNNTLVKRIDKLLD